MCLENETTDRNEELEGVIAYKVVDNAFSAFCLKEQNIIDKILNIFRNNKQYTEWGIDIKFRSPFAHQIYIPNETYKTKSMGGRDLRGFYQFIDKQAAEIYNSFRKIFNRNSFSTIIKVRCKDIIASGNFVVNTPSKTYCFRCLRCKEIEIVDAYVFDNISEADMKLSNLLH